MRFLSKMCAKRKDLVEIIAKGKDLGNFGRCLAKMCAKGKDLVEILAKGKDLGQKWAGRNKRRFGLGLWAVGCGLWARARAVG